MKKIFLLHILIFQVISIQLFGQNQLINELIKWNDIKTEIITDNIQFKFMSFEGSFADIETNLPIVYKDFPLAFTYTNLTGRFNSEIYVSCTSEESEYLTSIDYKKNQVDFKFDQGISRKEKIGIVSFIPIRKNTETGLFEKLLCYELDIQANTIKQNKKESPSIYNNESVLSSGDWYKIKIKHTGIHKLTFNQLQDMGLDMSSTNPKNIRIYGNGVGMLPESNEDFRYDDLEENAIYIHGENDGVFDENDYILFYGQSPHTWERKISYFDYQHNLYSNFNFYFVTPSLGEGKRIELIESEPADDSEIVNNYNDYAVVEDELVNLTLSGKKWYGDVFGTVLNRDYEFNFPGRLSEYQAIITLELANRTYTQDLMIVSTNTNYTDSITLKAVSASSTKYARSQKKTYNISSQEENLNINLTYHPSEEISKVWLDYIMVNVVRKLSYNNEQLLFRHINSVEVGNTATFHMEEANNEVYVWDVTDQVNPKKINTEFENAVLKFTLLTDSLREFLAFEENQAFIPEFVDKVENQNIHGHGPIDMVIVTHPHFIDQANQLKEIHEELDDMTILIVTIDQVYNEFSSGLQDPTAIRDMMRMFYKKYEGNEPRFLTLFGDGSFDLMNRSEHNTNFIPTFQTEESLITSASFVIDDYFGCLDMNEGDDGTGILDIGIGRLPVQTVEDAQIIIDKIKLYLQKGEPHFGNWRNKVCIIADDEDGNLHLDQADSIADGLNYIPKVYNQNKIYLDAYPQIRTPKGDTYPDVTNDIYEQIEDGALIINYIGHGGKLGWAHERILLASDIQTWNNTNKLPVFITATCEFSRFDEPELSTAGEVVLLNPVGGGIALFTTTRLAFSQSNFSLNRRIYEHMFDPIEGEMPYFGDLIRLSKPPGQLSTRNFVLLGDPALKLAYPNYTVNTLEINGLNPETDNIENIGALDLVTIKGEISDDNGNRIETFNGMVQTSIFDKKASYFTFGNDATSYPIEFHCQDKILWEGKATVTNGVFNISFVIPQDIAYNFGKGKISYYASSDLNDASGAFNEIVIGGSNENAGTDIEGPQIDLFLNDENFVSGDQTHSSPLMIAYLNDIHGINQSANGIGHSIIAILDNDHNNLLVLDDYYEPNLDSYQGGSILYPFEDLADGKHTLSVKAWDSYNNSHTTSIEFVINSDATLSLNSVINYPNPFYDQTIFSFNHTRPGDELEISLEVYDINGKIVLSYNNSVVAESTETPFLKWDGTGPDGSRLNTGVYIYTLKVTDESGSTNLQKQKLLLMD